MLCLEGDTGDESWGLTSPTDILIIILHVIDDARHVSFARSSRVATELGDHGFEIVLLEPLSQAVEVGGGGFGAVEHLQITSVSGLD